MGIISDAIDALEDWCKDLFKDGIQSQFDGISDLLQKQNIPYSAVVRKNDTVAVTVSKANAEAYKQIESTVKGERAVEFVNSDFFKALPKQERFTQRMDEGQARKKSAELTAKGVEHSAVFGGEKSAVTVAKKDSQRAFFSRGRMQRDALNNKCRCFVVFHDTFEFCIACAYHIMLALSGMCEKCGIQFHEFIPFLL